MISIVVSSQKDLSEYKDYVLKTCGVHKAEFIHILNKRQYSLAKAYNMGLEQAKNDIVVFVHDDVEFDTKNWGKKLLRQFKRNPEYGILGIAGTPKLVNGMWWTNTRDMRGVVNHSVNGKKHTNVYGNSVAGDHIYDTVMIDGVFMAVQKSKLKHNFDESFDGFHFYDIPFSLMNHLAGVKVGVTTSFRITHLSVGEVDDEWHTNKEKFEKKFKYTLPINIKNETFEHRPLKVLMGCLNFNGLTGSEISTMETAIGLSNMGCDVSVISNVGKEFELRAKQNGITTYQSNNPPFYIVGDGKIEVMTPEGPQKLKPGTLYPNGQADFDVIHANHKPVSEMLAKLYPNIPIVNFVRSEVIPLEEPIHGDMVKKYVAIRPMIKDFLIEKHNIPAEDIEVIYNPFDTSRFKPMDVDSGTDKEVILFVGTMDYLRKNAIIDLIDVTKQNNQELWLVGKNSSGYAEDMGKNHEHVKYFPPTDNIEEFYHKCTATAGIMLGRTTIEGYLCGKPGWIYIVDNSGVVQSKEFTEVPEDMSIFDRDTIIKKIKDTYIKAYNE